MAYESSLNMGNSILSKILQLLAKVGSHVFYYSLATHDTFKITLFWHGI